MGVDGHQNKLMSNLDVRIFIVTIFLSVVLLSISVTELLCSFKIIQDVASLAEWKFLLYYMLSESFPSLTIACFLNNGDTKKGTEQGSAINEVTGLYTQSGDLVTRPSRKRAKQGRTHQAGGSLDLEHAGIYNEIQREPQTPYDSEDSDFGDFNPNLHNHEARASEPGDKSGNLLANQSRMKLTDQSSSFSQSMLNNSASHIQAKLDVIQKATVRQQLKNQNETGDADGDGPSANLLLSGSDNTGLGMVAAMKEHAVEEPAAVVFGDLLGPSHSGVLPTAAEAATENAAGDMGVPGGAAQPFAAVNEGEDSSDLSNAGE